MRVDSRVDDILVRKVKGEMIMIILALAAITATVTAGAGAFFARFGRKFGTRY